MTINKDSILGNVDPVRMKNNGMTIAEEMEQMVSVNDDIGTKEKKTSRKKRCWKIHNMIG